MLWDNTVNLAFKKKEEIQPIQNSMAESISMDVKKFAGKVKRFRTMFRQNCPFSFHGPSSEAYKMIDEQEKNLQAIEKEAEDFHDLEELFELSESSSELVDSRREIVPQVYLGHDGYLNTLFEWSKLWLDIVRYAYG